MVGGFGDWKEITPEVQGLLDKHKDEISEKIGFTAESVVGTDYKTQVVAGTNYRIKAKVNGNKEIQVVIFEPLPHTQEPT